MLVANYFKARKPVAAFLLLTLIGELLLPSVSYALTTGPSQPEMQSFEPVGTTDMVNAFSGDFVYNIPLLDVEGYPINIAYHSGITAEEEASWVGLGWNINPGNISRAVRGIPDDFDGETIQKTVEINPELKKRFGLFFGLELGGVAVEKALGKIAKLLNLRVGGNISMGLGISNYTGVDASFGVGADARMRYDWFSAGVNMGATFNTADGVDLNAGASAGASPSKMTSTMQTTVTGSFGKGFNSREGLKYTSFGVNPSFKYTKLNPKTKKENEGSNRPEGVNNTMVPISMQNFVPVITNAAFMESNFYQLKVGIESGATIYPNFGGNYGEDRISFLEDGSRKAYGYLNLENATQDDITDFARDRDGRFNRDMQYLPPGSMTYDIFAVNGQGTAGNFRAARTDFGTVYDPYTSSESKVTNNLVEIGAGNIFEAGWDRASSFTTSTSGPWKSYRSGFSSRKKESLHEPFYFKQAGELTEASPEYYEAMQQSRPLRAHELSVIPSSPLENQWVPDGRRRVKRANLLYHFNAAEASDPNVSLQSTLQNYPNKGSMVSAPISRLSGSRRPKQISEFTQLLPDGRRYIYGIPAMNHEQREFVTSCPAPTGAVTGQIDISTTAKPYIASNSGDGDFGQKFYMETKTPSHAHSYLLSAIVSADYSDLTGDGLTPDDLGTYTKFNYSLKDPSFQWRTPYGKGMAQFDEGVLSDCNDDKATFIGGTKEIWMLHSIETKNFIGEFYVSDREDARSSDDPELGSGIKDPNFKLDSIKLYNRQERLSLGTAAVSVKKVVFTYDYSLCTNIPNSSFPNDPNHGKLTLKAISIKSGSSDQGYLSPYRFSYAGPNPQYSPNAKDMWGNYKDTNANAAIGIAFKNSRYPFVIQDSVSAQVSAAAWNLTDIRLPSGGAIHVSYEPDDYAFVQDRRAMEMFKIVGVGPDERFTSGSSLYQSQTNPYLYLYFKRKKLPDGSGFDEQYADLKKCYLGNDTILQYNCRVDIGGSDQRMASCPNTPLADDIKGYADVDAVGKCSDNEDYGYIKLSPKTVTKMPALQGLGVKNLQLNPITLATIFYARYYNNKALYPASQIVKLDGEAIFKQLMASFAGLSDYLRSPLAKYLNDNKAKIVDLDRSYMRLCTQGRKYGGGHRVKRIEFRDNWDAVSSAGQPVATYGSEYNYTVLDDASKRIISSGVACYEPMIGGDENPFKEPIITDRIGQNRDFPVVIPTELTIEGPIGESMYPGAQVGYSKVTVKSIHKANGASSQTIHESEFYTARDFPVRTDNTALEKLEDKKLKPFDFSANKSEALRVAQGYTLVFNDMHGKPKAERAFVDNGGETLQPVSFKKYEYYEKADGTLNNEVPCIDADQYGDIKRVLRVLGVETDMMLDSREKMEKTRTTGFMANLNIFMGPAFPIPIPTAFPKIPKSVEKTFSSIVNTKVVQQYGILRSVETYDKGASVKLSNEAFDPNTGQVLITKASTEHNDYELQFKTPAYWAYKNMGGAYHNILYEEDISNKATVVGDSLYIRTSHPERFNSGDELLLTINKGCGFSTGPLTSPVTFKAWVLGHPPTAPVIPLTPECVCTSSAGNALRYSVHHDCSGHNDQFSQFPNFETGNGLHDNLCGLTYANMIDYEQGNRNFLKEIRNATTGGAAVLPVLNDLINGNTSVGSGPLPAEMINLEVVGNGDYPEYPKEWRGVNNHPYARENHYAPSDSRRIYLWDRPSPWYHVDHKGTNTTYYAQVGNAGAYASAYPGKPIPQRTNKLLKVTITVGAVITSWFDNGTPGGKIKFLTLSDYHYPGQPGNNMWKAVYTLYFPYDASAPGNPTSAQIAGLNKGETRFKNENISISNQLHTSIPQLNGPAIDQFNPHPGLSGYQVNNEAEWFFSSTAEVITRPRLDDCVVAVARYRNAPQYPGAPAPNFPTNATIEEGTIKVIRSGRRNQLTEVIEELSHTATADDVKNGNLQHRFASSYVNVLDAAGTTFTDEAVGSESVSRANSTYYNPYVNGMSGVYRILSKYNVRLDRSYTSTLDHHNGLLQGLPSFWKPVATKLSSRYYNWLEPGNGPKWYQQTTVRSYSPWGGDLEVTDAAGNKQATLYGYGGLLPVASVRNSEWNNALCENFEDVHDPQAFLNFVQNPLRSAVRTGHPRLIRVNTAKHTGEWALNIINQGVSGSIPVQQNVPASYPSRAKSPFFFRPGKKYILSFWQAAAQNTANLSSPGILSVSVTGSTQQVYAKSPVIDGWVLYEGEISIPVLPAGSVSSSAVLNLAPGTVDDIRILPAEANMKCYVYYPSNRKLAATLDENHMSSLFEYDASGKLVRVKKETEKGILTLKESRSSTHGIWNGTSVDLKN